MLVTSYDLDFFLSAEPSNFRRAFTAAGGKAMQETLLVRLSAKFFSLLKLFESLVF